MCFDACSTVLLILWSFSSFIYELGNDFVINIANIVKINFVGSVQEICTCQFLKNLLSIVKVDSTNRDNALNIGGTA